MNRMFLAKLLIVMVAIIGAAYFTGVDADEDLVMRFLNSALRWSLTAAAALIVVNLLLRLIHSKLEKMR